MHEASLRVERERLVREHMDAEDRHDFEASLRTFGHCRYEVVPTAEVHDGESAVRDFYRESDLAFPDFHFANSRFHHAASLVIVETDFVGTQLGRWRGLPATGRVVRYAMCNLFLFEQERLVCERLYFDLFSILKQVGIARDPTTPFGRLTTLLNHPLTITRALLTPARRAEPPGLCER